MSRVLRGTLRLAILGLALASPAMMPAQPAAAKGGQHQAAASSVPPLTYQTKNAPVESAPVTYLVFWGQQWATGWSDVSSSGTVYSSSQAQAYITGFFKYLGSTSTNWNSSQTQYCSGVAVGTVNCGSSGVHVASTPVAFGGAWVDTTSPPPPPVVPDNCAAVVCLNPTGGITDQGNVLGQEAIRAETHFLGASGYQQGANYMIFLPKATATPGYGVYCAYHSEVIDSNGHDVTFTNMPYVMDLNQFCGTNFVNSTDNAFGNGWFDGYSIVAGHEFAEAETDPFPAAATAWLDSSQQETGDKCAWIAPGTPGGAYNIGPDSAGHTYAVQSLWSNLAMGCV